MKYEAALAELQAIVHKMESNELDIDQLSQDGGTAGRKHQH